MAKEYRTYGERRVVNGVTYYSQGCCSDGMEYGWVFKDERAFAEQPDEVCYIPEHAFDDVEPIEIDGERFYPVDSVGGYTRRQLEELVEGEVVGTAAERKAALMQQADVYIINRENVDWLVTKSGIPFRFDMIVIDELSSFKSWQAKRFKSLLKVTNLAVSSARARTINVRYAAYSRPLRSLKRTMLPSRLRDAERTMTSSTLPIPLTRESRQNSLYA